MFSDSWSAQLLAVMVFFLDSYSNLLAVLLKQEEKKSRYLRWLRNHVESSYLFTREKNASLLVAPRRIQWQSLCCDSGGKMSTTFYLKCLMYFTSCL